MTRTVTILGATGSVGRAAAEVIASAPGRFAVEAVTARADARGLAALAVSLRARRAVVADAGHYQALKDALAGTGVEAAAGAEAVEEAAAAPADLVVAAIAGFAGLRPLMRAIEQGRTVAIANKEPLVAAGPLVMAAARRHGTTLLPLDSEHNAIFQVYSPPLERWGLGGGHTTQAGHPPPAPPLFQGGEVERVVLTASGGPFWEWSAKKMANATPEEALAHPRWAMGAKISVDSATFANKALEVMEAHHLFGLPGDRIDVLVHPQAVVHGMAEYADGSVLAHMGPADMRTPIAHALAWPGRMPTPGRRLSITDLQTLEFFPPDHARFPALKRGYEALAAGPTACVAFNAANEVAVGAFLAGRVAFGRIVACIDHGLDAAPAGPLDTLAAIEAADAAVRGRVQSYIDHG
jgi:1-deoxy-D-xylulose-5-phosphate reductoisomerase